MTVSLAANIPSGMFSRLFYFKGSEMRKAVGIGKRVRHKRKAVGLNLTQTAAYLGLVDAAALCRIELGERKPDKALRALLEAFLAIPPAALRVRAAHLGQEK
jgi:ribosome-binding protein aMBF1 (putative translation factor)